MREESWKQAQMFGPSPDVVIELRFETVNEGLCWWQVQVYRRSNKELLALEAHPISPFDDGLPHFEQALSDLRQCVEDFTSPFGPPSRQG